MDNVNSPIVIASMNKLIPERSRGNRFDGKLDVNIEVGRSVTAGLEIPVGDCARDGMFPSVKDQAELAKRRKQRELLKGRNVRQNER